LKFQKLRSNFDLHKFNFLLNLCRVLGCDKQRGDNLFISGFYTIATTYFKGGIIRGQS
jgi:hypothetical protein